MTSDPTGLHRGVGTGQAASSQGPAARALGGGGPRGAHRGRHSPSSLRGSVPNPRPSPSGQLSPGTMGTPLSGRHEAPAPPPSAVPTSCQPGSQLGTLVPGGPRSPCPLLGSASRPPPPPPRPSNGWVMSAGGAGEGQGMQVPQALARGPLIRFANAICHRASIWGSR